MKKNAIPPEKNRPLIAAMCKLFGHKYRITKQYASNLKEFECTKCKKQFTLDRSGHYIPLTPKLKKVNEVFDRFYKKKHLTS